MKEKKNKQTLLLCSPDKLIFQSVCYPLQKIDYPSGGLFTTPCWLFIITSLGHVFDLACLVHK